MNNYVAPDLPPERVYYFPPGDTLFTYYPLPYPGLGIIKYTKKHDRICLEGNMQKLIKKSIFLGDL